MRSDSTVTYFFNAENSVHFLSDLSELVQVTVNKKWKSVASGLELVVVTHESNLPHGSLW